MIVCDTSVCLSVVFVQNSTTVLLHSLHSHSRQHETRGAQQHDVSTHHWQTELSPREDHQRRPLAHQQRLHRHVHNPRQHVRLRLTRSSRRYHDEHGELVPVERLEQERDVEGGAQPVHRICHIQYDQRDEQHQQHVARVALRLTPLPHASPFDATLPARTTKRPSNSPHSPAWPRARRTGGRIASARERSPQRQRARTDPNSLLVKEDAWTDRSRRRCLARSRRRN